jgi:ribosomal protein S12 methylthiotransferase
VSLVTLGCARNEVDSEELAARLEAAGWSVTGEGPDAGESDAASVVVVNTCGFIQAAKEDSIAELLTAAGDGRTVVAAGCLAERYGSELAGELPEAEVLSFDDYPGIAQRLDGLLAGQRRPAHVPRDRRTLLPLAPADRPGAVSGGSAGGRTGRGVAVPGHHAPAVENESSSQPAAAAQPVPAQPVLEGPVPQEPGPEGPVPPSGPRVLRRRLSGGIVAPLKIASGCDRRCSFCAIPSFRGSFVSRPVPGLLAEARWLAGEGARELVLVSENSTSYGKDLGNLRLLEELLPALAAIDGIARIRVSYLQPAELRPSLMQVIAQVPGVAPYFDLSFQHASGPVLRAMRRFGDRERFATLLGQIRELADREGAASSAGVRSNFIVGFPGESRADLDELKRFLEGARLDAIGIFGYSDEDGTGAASLPGKLDDREIAERVAEVSELAEELMAQRAEERIGEDVEVLVEQRLGAGRYEGRAAHQAPEVDGTTAVRGEIWARPGDLVRATVREADGVDLVADAVEIIATAAVKTPEPRTGPRADMDAERR